MLGGLAQGGVKALGGARFIIVNAVPTTVLVAFVTLLAGSGAYRLSEEPDLGKPVSVFADNAGLTIAAIFGVFVLAVLVRPFQVALVQMLEGYWERWRTLDRATALAIERHRRARHTAEVVREATAEADPPATVTLAEISAWQRHEHWRIATFGRAEEIVDRYPHRPGKVQSGEDDRLMPTVLGNVLRDGEDNAGHRYGLRLDVIGSRLYACLSPPVRSAIDRNLDLLNATVAMCVSLAAAAAVSSPLIPRWDLWSLIPLVVLALSVLAYRGAVRVASVHRSLLATAVDLHRFDMVAALHYKLPTTAEEEWKLNRALSGFLDGRQPATKDSEIKDREYVHPAAAPNGQPQWEGGAGEPPDSTE